jgi:arsenate reductase
LEFEDRDFFENPFTRAEVDEILSGSSATDMFNFRSPSFRKLGLTKDGLSDQELIALMLQEPRLIRRPIIVIDGDAHFGANTKVLETILK